MEKIALDVLGLQPSMSQTNSYSVVLSEQHGNRRLSILIGPFEAQAIAVAIEHIQPTRPLTHDLFKSVIDAFHTSVRETNRAKEIRARKDLLLEVNLVTACQIAIRHSPI